LFVWRKKPIFARLKKWNKIKITII